MEKINIVELLKDCPSGMKLDCTLYDNVEFDYIDENPELAYPIHCLTKTNGGYNVLVFTCNGCNDRHPNAKCVIFPKGKTTWKGFHRPFKDGEIVACDSGDNVQLFIFKNKKENSSLSSCYLMLDVDVLDLEEGMYYITRLATEEEKQKLFDAIKNKGYKWNDETKTLEKLIELKEDTNEDIVMSGIYFDREYYADEVELHLNDYEIEIRNGKPYAVFKNQETKISKPSFKIGDAIQNKFDITTLKPFDKVLVRLDNANQWYATWFSHIDEKLESFCRRYVTVSGKSYTQIIPYEGNEHLCGTKDNCDEFYKTW